MQNGLEMDSQHDNDLAIKRRSTVLEIKAAREVARTSGLTTCRERITAMFQGCDLKEAQFQELFADRDFCNAFFQLFDRDNNGFLVQEDWITMLKENSRIDVMKNDYGRDIIELLEAVAYLICQDDPISSDAFHTIMTSRSVPRKMMRLADTDGDQVISIEEMMNFIVYITKHKQTSQLSKESLEHLENVFRNHLGKGKEEFTIAEFKKIVPSKNPFFVERTFRIFDSDCSGTVSVSEFIETMHQFAGKSVDDKILFLFKIYDLDGDGFLQEPELRKVMKACMEENGMKFDERDIESLVQALYQDAMGSASEDSRGITIDDLKTQMGKHEGLLENLSISIGKWLVPSKAPKPKSLKQKITEGMPRQLSWLYLRQNYQLVFFILVIIFGVNIVLYLQRAIYFKDFSSLDGSRPNAFYLLSRASGRSLIYLSTLILLLILRHTITLLRSLGLATILPLDNNIYLHKMVGTLIFIHAWSHTITHLCNFAINVQPDPVKLVQLNNGSYWDWMSLGYNPPEGCAILNYTADPSQCPDIVESDPLLNDERVNLDFVMCQVCTGDAKPWNYGDWLFTWRPGVFGLVPGIANPTGVILIIVLTIMVVCSMPFVRRSGHFEAFAWTHYLYWAYWILLVLHAPDFWKWIVGPAAIFLLEMFYRQVMQLIGVGKTTISQGIILPSKVTNLIITRPPNFHFSSGDWVFIKIPTLAKNEWHPFTISSAPEMPGSFTLHIRGVGQWTNRLYSYFEEEYKRQQHGQDRPTRSSMMSIMSRKFASLKRTLSDSITSTSTTSTTDSFQAISTQIHSVESRERESSSMPPIQRARSTKKSFRYNRTQPDTVYYDSAAEGANPAAAERKVSNLSAQDVESQRPGKGAKLERPLEIHVDGPFGAPASDIFRAEHAVLIGTGIGITPFASILQSIMHRYWQMKRECPGCNLKWTEDLNNMINLRKVDFFWINRDQKSFEWFVNLLSALEIEQAEEAGAMGHFLEMHMYITSALQRTDMKAVGLQLALDLMHEKEHRDLITGLKSRTNAGRPNWNKVFTQLRQQNKGKITVFYCGNPVVGKILRLKCEEFGFAFKKEVF